MSSGMFKLYNRTWEAEVRSCHIWDNATLLLEFHAFSGAGVCKYKYCPNWTVLVTYWSEKNNVLSLSETWKRTCTILLLRSVYVLVVYFMALWRQTLLIATAKRSKLRVWIQPRARMSVLIVVCLSGRGLCDGPIPRPEESYWVLCVTVCDPETSRMRWPLPASGCCARGGKQ